MTTCDVCGDELDNVVGAIIKLTAFNNENYPELDKEYNKVLDKFGKAEFNVCFACLITAYGIKPIDN